ncbi:MAG: ABC transporter permease [Actinomycetia bacterium]|nr:ABC transporter permease [Actinomycetes bacterium]
MSAQTVAAVAPAVTARAPGKRPSLGRSFLEVWRSGSVWYALGEMVMAFVFALILGAILLVVSNPDILAKASYLFSQPSDFFVAAWERIASTYSALAKGSVGSWYALTETTSRAAPLILAGLGVGLGFRVGLFNIGGQGQAIWGTILAGYVGFRFDWPMPLHLPAAILAGLLGGAVWAGLAGFLRARFGANEVITTIMLNYIASGMLMYLLMTTAFRRPGRTDPISPAITWSATLPRIAGTRLHLGFLIALLAALAAWWLLERTRLGFQIRAVGSNADAAATAGMSVPFVLTIAMVIAGSLCGLAGTVIILMPDSLGGSNPLSVGMVGTVGFDAITVALLGRSKPGGTVLAGLLFGALNAGAQSMQSVAGTPLELASVLQALIVMFVAAPMLVRTLAPFLKRRAIVEVTRLDDSVLDPVVAPSASAASASVASATASSAPPGDPPAGSAPAVTAPTSEGGAR